MHSPQITVLIPNYNHARYLTQRIESVLNQSHNNLEIIIMDDCSLDNSREIIAKYEALDSRITVVYNEQNSGSTFKQWNKGFALAKGQYIWIAESDDYADNDFLKILLPVLEQDSQVGLVYSASYTVDEHSTTLDKGEAYFNELDPELWRDDFIADGLSIMHRFMLKSNIIPNASAVLIRKSAIEHIGFADETKRLVGDWLYWARILASYKIAYCAKPLNYFRRHTNNVRSGSAVSGIAILEFIDVLKQLKSYGGFDQQAYADRFSTLLYMWSNSVIYSTIPLKMHLAIWQKFKKLDSSTNQRIRSIMFSNRMSWVRMWLGDGLLYPRIEKIIKRK